MNKKKKNKKKKSKKKEIRNNKRVKPKWVNREIKTYYTKIAYQIQKNKFIRSEI